MKIKLRFSPEEIEIDPGSVLTFPNGLPGLESCKRFKLFHEENKPTIFWMQSLDDPGIIFSVADPALFEHEYEIQLSDAEVALLQVDDPAFLKVLVLLYRTGGDNAALLSKSPSPAGIEVNWRGPVIINLQKRLGMQKLLQHPRYAVRVYGE